ncbi:MAG: cytochrome P450 [Myxococcota bacterium]|nr:cytochrome P450 [Myxococcota bacterium]
MQHSTARDPDLDLKAPANVQDPFPVYRHLRDHEPVRWNENLSAWTIARYDDVLEVFNRPGRFSSDRFRRLHPRYASERPEVKAVAEVLRDWLVFRDPPDHTRLRGLLQKSFTPRHLEKNRDRIQATIDGLLDAAVPNGGMDFIRDFAFPLPALVIALLLGAPARDIEAIKRWSDRLAAYLGGAVDERDNFREAQAGLASLVDYFGTLLRERRGRPGDDLIDLMLRAEHEGDKLGEEEVVSNCVLLLFAGHETTTNLLGNGLFHLLRHPVQEQRLRADPGLLPTAVEELLRYDGPVPATAKIATEDVAWHGRRIERGQRVLALMSSANRDPSRFERPDALDVGRRTNRHLGFGFGIHFCLGAPLARLEAQLAFRTLLRRLPDLALGSEPARWKPMLFLRGLESLPVRWGDGRA